MSFVTFSNETSITPYETLLVVVDKENRKREGEEEREGGRFVRRFTLEKVKNR